MLAYLMYCIKDNPNVKHFTTTISDHLAKAAKVSWKLGQVDRCIRQLWEHNHASGYDGYDHQTLYYHGIDVLNFGDNDVGLKTRIRQRSQQISLDLARERGRNRATRSQRISHHVGLEDALSVWGMTADPEIENIRVEVPVRRPESAWSHSGDDMKVVAALYWMRLV